MPPSNEQQLLTIALIAAMAKLGADGMTLPHDVVERIAKSGAGIVFTSTPEGLICDFVGLDEMEEIEKKAADASWWKDATDGEFVN